MEFNLDLNVPSYAKVSKPVAVIEKKKEQTKIKDMFIIEEEPNLVATEINVFDLCKVPFFYACSKLEMLEALQPHSTDIAITKLSKEDWRKELKAITEILGFRSSIYILDDEGVHDSTVESWLHHYGYHVEKEGKILGYKVFEYGKGLEFSIIDCFNEQYTLDIFSIIFISSIDHSAVVYCDVTSLIDIFYYAVKNDKNVLMPIPFDEAKWVEEYLNSKVQETTKINSKMEFQLF